MVYSVFLAPLISISNAPAWSLSYHHQGFLDHMLQIKILLTYRKKQLHDVQDWHACQTIIMRTIWLLAVALLIDMQVVRNSTKHDYLTSHISYHILAIPHHMSCKNKLDASTSLFAIFTWFLWFAKEAFLPTYKNRDVDNKSCLLNFASPHLQIWFKL
jgi:hypothetical protein